VFITVRTYSNKVYCRQFALSRTTTSWFARTERLYTWTPHCSLGQPAFQCAWVHSPVNWPPNSPNLNPADYSVWEALQQMASQNFRDWSAEASSDRLLGWAKSGHNEPSDWSSAKKTDDGCQASRQRVVMLKFVWT